MDKVPLPRLLVLFWIAALTGSCVSLECEVPGSFADVTNCRNFIRCEVDANGILRANVLSCNTSEVFNPALSKCVLRKDYICMQDDLLHNTASQNSVSLERNLLKDFICIWPGIKFPDYSSMNCSDYFACIYRNGSVRKVLQSCPTNHIFDIENNMCMDSTLSKCHRSAWGAPDKIVYKYIDFVHNTNITVTTLKNLSNCRDTGRFLNVEKPDCRNYMSCERNATGYFTKQYDICPNRYIFDPFLSICVEEKYFQCQVTVITDANLHEYYGSYAEYMKWRSLRHKCGRRQRCKNVGIFPDYSVPGCRGFQLCLKSNEFSYKSISHICPQGYVFNPVKSMCTMNDSISCPCNIQCDSENTTIEIDHHVNVPNPDATTEANLLPPNNNTNTNTSEINNCPKTIERCKEEGLFPNYRVQGCKHFILCTKLNKTDFTMLDVYCPANYAFDANDLQCKPANSFNCICQTKDHTTKNTTVKPDSSIYVTTESISTGTLDNYTSTTGYENTSILYTNAVCHKSINDTFCTKTGFMPDFSVTNCNGYKLCLGSENGSFVEYKLTCPKNSVFDTSHNMCLPSDSFKCACKEYKITYDDTASNIGPSEHLHMHENILNEKSCPVYDCLSAGLIPEHLIPDCRGYKSCVKVNENVLIVMRYLCPFLKVFDKNTATCVESTSYICPCNNSFENIPVPNVSTLPTDTTSSQKQTSEPVFTYTSTESGLIIDIAIPSVEVTTNNTVIENTTTIVAANHTTSSNTSESHLIESISTKTCIVQECPASGRHPDYAIPNCRGYKLCLRAPNNTFNEIRLECPHPRIFDIRKSICVEPQNYVCPCINAVETTVITIETTPYLNISSPTISTESNVGSQTNSYLSTISLETSTHSGITDTQVKNVQCPVTIEACIAVGRYPDYSANDCSKFFLCVLLNDGTYSKLNMTCPDLNIFDRNLSQCVKPTAYECPCITSVQTESANITDTVYDNSTNPGPTTIIEASSLNQTNTITNNSNNNDIYNTITEPNIISSTDLPNNGNPLIDPILSTIMVETSTFSGITGTQVTVVKCPASIKICTAVGRHADYSANDCSKFFLCVLLNDGTYSKLSMTCPGANIFDRNLSQCVKPTAYECPCITSIQTESINIIDTVNSNTTNPGSIAMTEVSTLNETSTITSNSSNNDTYSTITESYIISSTELLNNKSTPVDPMLSTLSVETSTSSGITGTQVIVVKCPVSIETCTSVGRYPDYSANDCSKFFLCVLLNDGTYSKLNMTCPGTNIFDVNLLQCVNRMAYHCPCVTSVIIESDTVTHGSNNNITSPGLIVTTETSVTNPSVSTEGLVVNTEATTNASAVIYNPDINVVCPESITACPADGYYPDYSSNNCKRYFHCSSTSNGSFSMLSKTCPVGQVFETNISICVESMSYQCPCVVSSTNGSGTTQNSYNNNGTGDVVNVNNSNSISTETSVIGINSSTEASIAITQNTGIYETSTVIQNVTNAVSCPEHITTCVAPGRYADYTTGDCSRYFLCVQLNNGAFSKLNMTCPGGNLFDANISQCVNSSYGCPCKEISIIDANNTSNGTNNNTTHELITDRIELNMTTTLTLDVTTQPSILEFITSTLNSTNNADIVSTTNVPPNVCLELPCSKVGRLADYSVSGCRGYKLCISASVGFDVLKLLCPSPNIYDPLKSICVEPQKYQCTCP